MDERHLVVNVTSDASQYAWGGIVYNPSGPPLEARDIWREDVRDKPIAVKEALARVNTLKAGKSLLSNCHMPIGRPRGQPNTYPGLGKTGGQE